MRRYRSLFAPLPSSVPPAATPLWWRILGFIGRWLRRACIAMGALTLLSGLLLSITITLMAPASSTPLPDGFALYMTLDAPLTERPAKPSLTAPFAKPTPTVREIVDTLDAAAQDPRVLGLVLRMREGGQVIELEHAEEVRAAVKRFAATGKWTRAYASSWDGGIGPYYLASAFEEIWMQPMGVLAIGGLRAEQPFLREALDKIGAEPQMYQRKEYKSAYESLTRKNMSPQARQVLEVLLQDIGGHIVSQVAGERKMKEDVFKSLVDKGFFTAPAALREGLITRSDYADVMADEIEADVVCTVRAKTESQLNTAKCKKEEIQQAAQFLDTDSFVDFTEYSAEMLPQDQAPGFFPTPPTEQQADATPRIALIYVSGVIMAQEDSSGANLGPGVLMGEDVAAADKIAGAILEAADNEAYGAIVLRVDSPGGSPVASETIARAIEIAKRMDKTVIISMGPLAASGGYWVSAPADRIFAGAHTLTGSIGVVGGKFVLGQMWENLLIHWDGVSWGRNAGIWSSATRFTPEQEAQIGVMLDAVYDAFVARVAKGRNMSPKAVEDIARGRVWTGKQALERGLVDALGGLTDALDYAATTLDAKDRTGVEIDILPRPLSAFEELLEILEGGTQVIALQATFTRAWNAALSPSSSSMTPQMYESLRLQ